MHVIHGYASCRGSRYPGVVSVGQTHVVAPADLTVVAGVLMAMIGNMVND